MKPTSEPSLFDEVAARNHRRTDPITSRLAARTVTAAASQRASLLSAYRAAGCKGLTDEEAARAAGLLGTGYWKRCSDLRGLGCIVATGDMREQTSGRLGMVCRFSKEDSDA